MDTRSTTALNDMSKQIDELRSSQTQQTEEIRKELNDKINGLEALIEKYFANAHVTQREGKQTEAASSAIVTDGSPQTKDPPDRFNTEHNTSKPTTTNVNNNNNNPPIHHGLSARLTKIGFPMFDGITLAPDHALSIFLTNMHQHLALHVRQFKVSSVPEPAKIAKLHELSLSHTPIKTLRPTYNSSQKSNFSHSNRNQHNSTTTPTTAIVGNQNNKPLLSNPPQKRISFEEMQERKRKGLCMFCVEPFTPGHHLKHRRAEFLFMEADTEFDEEIALEEQIRETTLDDVDDKVPTISVHALNGRK
ncbi:hypothetical protein F2Q69_00021094 [Brassica cretica]|uniref:Uncharacterized protein n=1 Tax=Brassica cretica TaxID=69181 RepID=A0A8S9QE70_BRACR|nr:hypothetical protein F2Q69_00021094 [Brassica cretica]